MKLSGTSIFLINEINNSLFGKKARITDPKTGKITKKGKTIRGKSKITKRFLKRNLRSLIKKSMHPGPKRRDRNGKRLITVWPDLEPNRQRNIRNRLEKKGA